MRLTQADRLLWSCLSRVWRGWRSAVVIVRPETVLAWHRRGFRLLWTWKSRHGPGRPAVPPDVRALICTIADANPMWGAPRIHGELSKLGIAISQATVAKYVPRRPAPPIPDMADVPCQSRRPDRRRRLLRRADRDLRLLFVLVILAHPRRNVIHMGVTAHPTAAWTGQQLRDAFPEDTAPRYLVYDRDHAFAALAATVGGLGIEDLRTAPRSPWQKDYASYCTSLV